MWRRTAKRMILHREGNISVTSTAELLALAGFRPFTVRATRPHTSPCGPYEVETGLELRLSYGDDVMRSQLFRGVDRDDRLAEAADAWHLALLQEGFSEIQSINNPFCRAEALEGQLHVLSETLLAILPAHDQTTF
jgi:hypothetical protein